MAAAPEPLEERIRVLVVDDERLFVEMVVAMLAADPRIDVVARAAAERHDVRLQAARIETILERAARGRRA